MQTPNPNILRVVITQWGRKEKDMGSIIAKVTIFSITPQISKSKRKKQELEKSKRRKKKKKKRNKRKERVGRGSLHSHFMPFSPNLTRIM